MDGKGFKQSMEANKERHHRKEISQPKNKGGG